MKYKDYYKILGTGRDAGDEEIKKAYRKLARKYHPDVSKEPNAKERFQEASEAYETLRDKDKRAAYDSLGSHRPGRDFRPPPDWFDRFGQGNSQDLGGIDLADLFESFGRRGRGRNIPISGEDYEVAVHLTLEEAWRGAERKLRIGERSLQARIPRGATDGHRLRLAGKGSPGANGGPPGDLYLRIILDPHPLYRVSGHDLDIDVPLAPWEAALGADVDIPTLEGRVRMKVPASSNTGQKLRLAGKGLPRPGGGGGGGGAGDLYAVLRIVVPATLTEREKKLFEELRAASRFDPRGRFSR
jgi:curved DNA-binding protein